jgi:glutamate formiminotransferase/formiminotetrahydrofolate cyclodeaminase
MRKIIECVPNFSEGRDPELIRQITDSIQSVEGVRLLNVDPGKATNRTVVTFVGEPQPVIDAAFLAIAKAGDLIDMRLHQGEHPRMGATDVCPLVPVDGISMEETADWSRRLAERVGKELGIPVYLYEAAQQDPERSNLSFIRSGEYEGFFKKIEDPRWKPDFGPRVWDAKRGGTVIGARDFLLAYNVNLNTVSVRRANSIAFDVREAGRSLREGDPVSGKVMTDAQGKPLTVPGSLRAVKAIGWFIEEYGIAQISMNLTNLQLTPLHRAFDEVCQKAAARGIRVTGSELVGLIPLKCLREAGKYFLKKQRRSCGVSEKELIRIAVKSLGLDELGPFDPQTRVIEYLMQDPSESRLAGLSLEEFADRTASELPTPGGGSVAAYLGVLGSALATMVANLSANKKEWDARWEEFSGWAEKGEVLKSRLLALVDADTRAFNEIISSLGLPRSTGEEKSIRTKAIQEATRKAVEIPLEVMQSSLESMELIEHMAKEGNPNSVSDAGVAAVCARGAVIGAHLNIKINARSLTDAAFADRVKKQAQELESEALRLEAGILALVDEKILS